MTQAIRPEVLTIETPQSPWEEPTFPDVTDVIIDDGKAVDNLLTEKQQRLLVSALYSSFSVNNPLIAMANVGLFYGVKEPPLVPDVLLSLNVRLPEDWSEKRNLAYFVWNLGKPPEVVIEIVSNKVGKETGSKLLDYARIRVAYYVIFDPLHYLGERTLSVYQLKGLNYQLLSENWLEDVGLGLTLWEGEFEGKSYQWLRWCDSQGELLLTGDEKSQKEHQRAEQEKQRAEQEKQRAEQEKQRADYLAEILRSHGIDYS